MRMLWSMCVPRYARARAKRFLSLFVARVPVNVCRDIAAGEELVFSYGTVGSTGNGSSEGRGVPCYCGAPSCCGRMPFDPRVA
jgi:hypothetical protein